jgi:hypothetical protein
MLQYSGGAMLAFHHVFDFVPTWAPLERLAALIGDRPGISPPEVESYMYMGVVTDDSRSLMPVALA